MMHHMDIVQLGQRPGITAITWSGSFRNMEFDFLQSNATCHRRTVVEPDRSQSISLSLFLLPLFYLSFLPNVLVPHIPGR